MILGKDATPLQMAFLVIFAKGGFSGCFVNCYVATSDIFPTLFCSTALGICNFTARLITVMAPEIAEREAPIPMMCLVVAASVAMVLI